MKVRNKVSYRDLKLNKIMQKGDERDLDDQRAKDLIKKGLVERVPEAAPPKPPTKPKAPAAKKPQPKK